MLRFAILASLLASTAAFGEPLVKPVVPAKTMTRVDFPLTEGEGKPFMVAGFVQPFRLSKEKSTPATPGDAVKVGISSGYPMVTVLALKHWGYQGVAGKQFTLPSLTLVGEAKLMGKPALVHIKLSNIVLNVVKSAFGSDENVSGADLQIALSQTLLAPATQSELWMTFDENATLQISYPATAVKKAGEAEERKVEPVTPDPERVPVKLTLSPADFGFNMVAFHGKPAVAKAKMCGFDVSMTSKNLVYATMPTTREYMLKPDDGDFAVVEGADKVSKVGKGTAKDLRLTAATGAGLKTPIDLYFETLPISIDAEAQQFAIYVGPGYMKQFLHASLLAVGSDGIPRLYGYVQKGLTLDPKAKK
jgi:hypothetical protein